MSKVLFRREDHLAALIRQYDDRRRVTVDFEIYRCMVTGKRHVYVCHGDGSTFRLWFFSDQEYPPELRQLEELCRYLGSSVIANPQKSDDPGTIGRFPFVVQGPLLSSNAGSLHPILYLMARPSSQPMVESMKDFPHEKYTKDHRTYFEGVLAPWKNMIEAEGI